MGLLGCNKTVDVVDDERAMQRAARLPLRKRIGRSLARRRSEKVAPALPPQAVSASERTLIMLGGDGAGKSTLVAAMRGGDVSKVTPTVGFDPHKCVLDGAPLRLFDSLFETKGRTRKRGTLQLARTRDTSRAKQSYTGIIIRNQRASLCETKGRTSSHGSLEQETRGSDTHTGRRKSTHTAIRPPSSSSQHEAQCVPIDARERETAHGSRSGPEGVDERALQAAWDLLHRGASSGFACPRRVGRGLRICLGTSSTGCLRTCLRTCQPPHLPASGGTSVTSITLPSCGDSFEAPGRRVRTGGLLLWEPVATHQPVVCAAREAAPRRWCHTSGESPGVWHHLTYHLQAGAAAPVLVQSVARVRGPFRPWQRTAAQAAVPHGVQPQEDEGAGEVLPRGAAARTRRA